MRQSKLFTTIRREDPKDEESKNAKLLIRAGFVHKEMAGVYSYLPLGWRVMDKVIGIIREEMNAIGGQEVFLSSLQDASPWKKSGRWSEEVMDVWFKTKLKNDTEVGLANTHEEALATILKDHVSSYRDLPLYIYQFQTKFRNEARAKSGIMRTREFLMKDLYSFSRTQEEHDAFYEKAKEAYRKIFERTGIGESTYFTLASGGSFSKYSHEFQTLTEAGEDTIYICETCHIAVNKEVLGDQPSCPECKNENLVEKTAVEVGNIFSLGTRYAEALDLSYLNEDGQKQFVVMGSYGIGPGRLIGTAVEVFADEKGIVWPSSIAPFDVHVIQLPGGEKKAKETYEFLQQKGVDVLLDDREEKQAGEKFAEADLIGIPWRVVVSEKTVKEGRVEIKRRGEDQATLLEMRSIPQMLKE